MMVVTGIVLVAKFVLAGFVGVKLLRLPAPSWLSPERMLAIHFLVANLVGGIVIAAAYGAWSSMGRAGSPDWLVGLHALGQHLTAIGFATILIFTQRTFHPDSRIATAVTWTAIGIIGLTLLGRWLWEGFAISIEPGAYHWAAYGIRMMALCWVGGAAFAYWTRMRKRTKLGLADPLLTNRFLLWSVWAFGNLAIACSEPAARLFYAWTAGESQAAAESITGIAGPIIQITLLLTSLFGSVTTFALFLTFFPTEGYRRLVTRRAATPTG